jgi:opacity protein-like surface antigen
MLRRIAWFAGTLLVACVVAPSARAAEFYVNGTFMQSLGRDSSSGLIEANTLRVLGSDGDSSLGYGIGIGFGFDFDEVLPKKWNSWGTAFRVESEFVYGREWDFVSHTEDAQGQPTPHKFFDEVKAWTFMPVNLYIDVPIRRPLSKIFGRVPRLEPFDFSFGFGAGISHVHINAFDNIGNARDSVYKFAFQGNAALTYEINERTRLQVGYRYLDLGSTDAELQFNGTNVDAGEVDLDLYAHEIVLAVRYGFHQKPLSEMEFPWPDWMPRWLGGETTEQKAKKPQKPKKNRRWFKRPSWLGGEKEI